MLESYRIAAALDVDDVGRSWTNQDNQHPVNDFDSNLPVLDRDSCQHQIRDPKKRSDDCCHDHDDRDSDCAVLFLLADCDLGSNLNLT